MSDAEKHGQLEALLEHTKQLSPEDIEAAVRLAKSLMDPDDRDYSLCAIAERLALSGGLNDLDRAIELARSVTVMRDRHSALVVIATRFAMAREGQYALQITDEAGRAASQMEASDEYQTWEKAVAWEKVASLYLTLAKQDQANFARTRALELATSGQYDENQQNANECSTILLSIIRKLVVSGQSHSAISVAELIKSEQKRIAWIEALVRLANID